MRIYLYSLQMISKKTAKKYGYVLIALCVLALMCSVTVICLQAAYGYTGRQQTQPITFIPVVCANVYRTIKYIEGTLSHQIMISFITACLTGGFVIGIIALLIYVIYGLYLTQQQSNDYLQPSITHLKIKALYILISVALLCNTVNFGKLLAFLIDIKEMCRQKQFKNQIIPMIVISGVTLLSLLIAAIITLVINLNFLSYLNDNEVVNKPLLIKEQQSKIPVLNYPQNIQMTKYRAQDTYPRQRNKNINMTEEPLIQEKQKALIQQKQKPRKTHIPQVKGQNLLNPYYQSSLKKSYNKDNPLFNQQAKSNNIDRPVNLFSPSNQSKNNTPKQGQKQGVSYYKPRRYQPYFQTAEKSKFREPQKIIPERANQIDQSNPRRLHSTYFKGQGLNQERNNEVSPNRYRNRQNPVTPQKKGMMIDYIRGKYAN